MSKHMPSGPRRSAPQEPTMTTFFAYFDSRLREDPRHLLQRAAYHIVCVVALLAFLILIH
jgi:hypothetical protein